MPLRTGQDLREFYAFARKDSILKHVLEDLYGMHGVQAASLFNSVMLAVCLQMARLARSKQMMQAIDGKYGDVVEFDGKRVLLQPPAVHTHFTSQRSEVTFRLGRLAEARAWAGWRAPVVPTEAVGGDLTFR